MLAFSRNRRHWSFRRDSGQGRREVKKSPVQVTICPLHPQLGFPKSILALQYRATLFSWVPLLVMGPGTVYRLYPLSVALTVETLARELRGN